MRVFSNRFFLSSPRNDYKINVFRHDTLFIIFCIIWPTLMCGCGTPFQNRGLRAEYPEQRFELFFIDPSQAGYVPVDSLQPTLQWESFPREKDMTGETKILGQVSDVTYQLRIMTEGWYYSRDDLREAYHRIEVLLRPSTKYLWTVRACFKLNGEPRCTIWGSVSLWEHWSYSHPNYSSYRFKTPAQ
jgi:hypothetical protein